MNSDINKEILKPEINPDVIIKLYKTKGYYNGFAWINCITNPNTTIENPEETTTEPVLLIYMHLITGIVYSTVVNITKNKAGISYSTDINTTCILDNISKT